jgi:hypothetical protein
MGISVSDYFSELSALGASKGGAATGNRRHGDGYAADVDTIRVVARRIAAAVSAQCTLAPHEEGDAGVQLLASAWMPAPEQLDGVWCLYLHPMAWDSGRLTVPAGAARRLGILDESGDIVSQHIM